MSQFLDNLEDRVLVLEAKIVDLKSELADSIPMSKIRDLDAYGSTAECKNIQCESCSHYQLCRCVSIDNLRDLEQYVKSLKR